ncbi:4'-phosphopantetheinyl transferase family protein [Pseudohongiella nitratireducens]|uniref:4'-phosphopantetheinyl transferase family protein n=1 Tax=Pseudohongiella nitratireducens TaxID=1768907 RepID=UPI0030EDCE37|tara:strand:- start:2667 stop:3530 length:864 start_codon:yes stop_codon:yes gene_type:complete
MTVQDLWLLPLPDMSLELLLEREGHVLAEAEKAQLDNKRLPKGKHMYAFTRIALRHVLSRYETHVAPGEWQFSRKSAGKPIIGWPESSLHFNLTHADDLLVIAVCNHAEVGVDVEALDREVDVMALSVRYYQPQEIRALSAMSEESARRHRFLTLWTLKEAAVKATGKGLSRALRDFSFTLQAPGSIQVEQIGEAGQVAVQGKEHGNEHGKEQCTEPVDEQINEQELYPEFWTFTWQDYLLSTAMLRPAKLSEASAASKTSLADWRCFSWKWPDLPVTETLPLQWHS